jgi:hypothetical protein
MICVDLPAGQSLNGDHGYMSDTDSSLSPIGDSNYNEIELLSVYIMNYGSL